jgi:tripartite-type tricarboxylate transporter receptor subunit TctC
MHRRHLLLATLLPLPALAQGFPDRAVRLVVPYSGGGGVDIMSRALARSLAPVLGANASVFVDNKPGGATRVGTTDVAQARPDGHTLLVIPPVAWIGYFYSKAFDRKVWRDLTPVAQFANAPYSAIITRAGSGLTTWQAVLDKARRTPGGLNAGSPAFGGFVEYFFNQMLRLARIEGTLVPFRGGGEMMTALAGGQIDINILSFGDALARVRNGEAHLIAHSADGRHPLAPEVPSFTELGIGDALMNAFSVWAPPGLPAPIQARLAEALRQAVQDPALVDLLSKQMGYTVDYRAGDHLQPDLDAIDALWGPRLEAAYRQ